MVLLIVPAGSGEWMAAPAGARTGTYRAAADIAGLLAGEFEAAVLWSDGVPADDLPAVAAAVRACGKPVIEVHGERWDGTTFSPLSAACRGVISGFGANGVRAARDLLLAEAHPAE